MVGQVTDMRKGFAALTPQAEAALQQVPFARHLVVLRGRRGDGVKVIWCDGQAAGKVLTRLARGRFLWPTVKTGRLR